MRTPTPRPRPRAKLWQYSPQLFRLNLALILFSAIRVSAASSILGTTSLLEGPSAGTNSVALLVPEGNYWTATTDASWLHVAQTNGTGSTILIFGNDRNLGATRTGTLNIADQVLTVTQAGASYTAAPPPATTLVSGLNYPFSITADENGNLFFTDNGSGAVKEWVKASNAVVNLTTGWYHPTGIAVDKSGNVYFSTANWGSINEFVVASNVVRVLVSGLENNLYDITAIAVDDFGNIIFTDSLHGAVKKWIASSNSIITLASGLNYPEGVAVDHFNNVYIADTYNNVLKKWSATDSNVTVIASGFSHPMGLTVDGSGNIYIGDVYHNAIKKWTAVSNAVSTVISVGLSLPFGVAVNGAGDVYVLDNYQNEIKVLPHAFVSSTAKTESFPAGSDSLPAVIPATAATAAPFVPTSDQPWLTVSGVTNGIISFEFAANRWSARTAHLNVVGQSISISQSSPPNLFKPSIGSDGLLRVAFINMVPTASYSLLSSTNLSLPITNWIAMDVVSNRAPGLVEFFTPVVTNDAQRFFIISYP